MTLAEVQRLMIRLATSKPPESGHCLRWSQWRRRHQAHARHCHYQRQSARQQ
jgi:hypothetical protein